VDGARPFGSPISVAPLHTALIALLVVAVSRRPLLALIPQKTSTRSLKAARELKKTLASLTPFGMTGVFLSALFGMKVL
jgi:hypothetical protein